MSNFKIENREQFAIIFAAENELEYTIRNNIDVVDENYIQFPFVFSEEISTKTQYNSERIKVKKIIKNHERQTKSKAKTIVKLNKSNLLFVEFIKPKFSKV